MNESNPENAPIEVPPVPAFKDRSGGLTAFGILTIVLGCLAGLMALLMVAATALSAAVPNAPPQSLSTVLMVMCIYGGLAVALIWLGIGSIKARRWARALILIFSWTWLVMGIFMVFFMGFLMPKAMLNTPGVNGQPALPPGSIAVMTVFLELFFGFFFVVLPIIWIFFYANHHTRATVEMRDPVRRWTDACPLPVLGLSLWLLFSALTTLFLPVLYHGVAPFFGVFLSGLPGSLVYLVMAAVWAYCAWRLYKMDIRAWWIVLIAMTLYGASSLMTFARHDIVEMYQLMGYRQAQIDQIRRSGLFEGNSMMWMMLVFFVPFLGYIVYVKQYFTGDKVAQV